MISNKLYGYKLVYTNELVVLTGTVSVSPIKWKGKAKIIKGRGSATKGAGNTKTNISSEMQNKILEGKRKSPTKNGVIGGYSSKKRPSGSNCIRIYF
ncbi:hypothetical protein CTM_14123 [Clostridium tetanomorphum DSM 665]|nr:hypothetical protein CTM_14123 [Clostridium tetanomorphum DSM 665]